MFALARAKEKHIDVWYFDTDLHELEKIENYVETRAEDALEKMNLNCSYNQRYI